MFYNILFYLFQFLLVRLKERLDSISKVFTAAFQFLLVRLKAIQPVASSVGVYQFQFLLVRLKEKLIKFIRLNLAFQFLLVRLKEKHHDSRRRNEDISIPSGTIKSLIFRVKPSLLLISIPSGTIKSYLPIRPSVVLEKFQFLLVRLKVHNLHI